MDALTKVDVEGGGGGPDKIMWEYLGATSHIMYVKDYSNISPSINSSTGYRWSITHQAFLAHLQQQIWNFKL